MKKFFFLTILSIFVLVACKRSDDEPRAQKSPTIAFGSPSRSVGMGWKVGRTRTRAAADIPGDIPEEIGVFAYYDRKSDQEVFGNQRVYYFYSQTYADDPFTWKYWNVNSGEFLSAWPYTITDSDSKQKPWKRQNYRFLAYAPWNSEGVRVSANNYNFNTLNWDKIPEYTDCDYLIAKRIVAVDNTSGSQKTANLVTFEMQHLMSRVRFVFAMSEHYRQIRRIVINSISVKTSGKYKSVAATYKIDNSLNVVNWNDLTDTAPAFVAVPKDAKDDYDVQTAFADAAPFGSIFVMPQTGFNELTLTVNYSTYDSSGLKTRNAEISNTVNFTDRWNLEAGKYYDLRISIVPDYLYVLSDNDQDFDGWVIVNE